MKCTIVYLEPRSSYKADLHSDTLWAALCWAYRMVHGADALEKLIKAYEGEANGHEPFYISSTFPFQEGAGKPVLFFPLPLGQSGFELSEKASFEKTKSELREWKALGKQHLTDLNVFQYAYGGKDAPREMLKVPKMDVRPMTHNTISRLTGSTLSIKERGQLFHMEERFINSTQAGRKAGLYFLLKGNIPQRLEGALRFLEHYGIGGDRSIGKGAFRIEWEQFELEEPADANAMITLSLYRPTEQERLVWQKSQGLNYKLIARRGWKSLQAKGASKQPMLYFTEGSVFPLAGQEAEIYGGNLKVGRHDGNFDIYQYGYGFMVKIKIS